MLQVQIELTKNGLESSHEFRTWTANEREETLLRMGLHGQFHRETPKIKRPKSIMAVV